MRYLWNGKVVLTIVGLCCAGSLNVHGGAAGSLVPLPSLETLALTYGTPKQLARFLRETIQLTTDEALFGADDYWQTPEEILERRAGDCEDFALLAQAILERQGVEAYVFSVYGAGGYAHTVCVFVEGGRYSVINQNRVRQYRAPTLEAVAGRLYAGWRYGAVAERVGSRGAPTRFIWNPDPSPALSAPAADSFFSF